ncbi:hypothetical protein WOLCODRAFT_159635 [Wolfiporia cocos MD-104 SS10]|uniref:Uncharacterized protein n=1 Tax=Wolfiporia cocos (strain MD-104) TaxID=742152 RepID=A0A2H3JLB1_WOLCO|nr:hypothetical protein WOLCODRAFT_159635 [Wolfiporia cocos MD-104 SS10]
MRAQRGSRPDDKSQRSVQVRAPTQAPLKSPTWGNEEDDGPMAHPPAVSRYETRPALTRAGEAPPALPTAPLDWTTPSRTLPRAPARQGGPTRGGSPLRPCPLPGQRRKHLGSKHNGAHRPPWTKTRQLTSTGIPPSAHGGTVRLNNRDLRRCSGPTTKHPRLSVDPRGNPARAPIERGAASAQSHTGSACSGGLLDIRVQTRTPPDSSGSDKAIRPTPQPPTPRRIKRKGGQRRIIAKATRRAPQSNSGAAALPKRATPSADRAPTGRAAGTPQGSELAEGRNTPTPL